MRHASWAKLFRHIPAEHQNTMMLVTKAGVEITLTSILRVDHELVVIKGRLAGSQDTGRVYFISFDNIDYVGYAREVKDEEFHEVYGSLEFSTPAAAVTFTAAPAEAPPAPAPVPKPEPGPEPVAAPPANGTKDAAPPVAPSDATASEAAPPRKSGKPISLGRIPIKSEVLERFRARNSDPGTARPPE
jgi:hypothetical protein